MKQPMRPPYTGGKTERYSSGADDRADAMRDAIRNTSDQIQVTGTCYYISYRGDDSADGLNPETAVRNIEEIRARASIMKPGDAVFFERGGVYRTVLDLNAVSGVTYAAYGTGEKPIISGSYCNYARTDIWQKHEENIWKISYFPHRDAGVMVFDNGDSSGTKCGYYEDMNAPGFFYHDHDQHTLYLYCACNPAEKYHTIDIGCMTRLLNIDSGNNIKVDNLHFYCTGLFGIQAGCNTHDVTVTNCTFDWIGGAFFTDCTNRFGNAVQFSGGCEHILIENCWFDQIFDTAATFQMGGNPYRDFTLRGNLFEYTGMGGFEWWPNADWYAKGIPDDPTPVEDITVEHNIFRQTGYGWSKTTRCPVHIRGTWAPKHYTNLKNIVIRENVFDCSAGYIFACAWESIPDAYRLENNEYYQKKTVKRKETDPGYPAFDMILGHPTFADGQEQLETAVRQVEPCPKSVIWLE